MIRDIGFHRMILPRLATILISVHCTVPAVASQVASRSESRPSPTASAPVLVDDLSGEVLALERRLALQCAPALSRELCGDLSGRADLTAQARQVLTALGGISARIEAGADEEEDADDELPLLVDRIRHFGELFAALGRVDGSEMSTQRLIDACADLAGYLDDPDPAIAEAAKLWQGVAYRRAGRADRALQILKPVLSKPVDPRLGFWLRIERCRALADRGDIVGAISLSMRLEKRVDDWFSEDMTGPRAAARNTLLHLRGSLWRQWSDQLDSAGKSQDADAAAEQAKTIGEGLIRVPRAERCLELVSVLPADSEDPVTSAPAP